jgi:hypothetical protein
MLSYGKHGKFPALIQAAQAESRRKKRPFRPNDIAVVPVPRLQWIMGWNGLQMRRVRFSGPEDNWSEWAAPRTAVLRRREKRRRTVGAAVTPRPRQCSPR